ncbi:MAG: polymer-forming cytoskeletal protein [bacterium]
MRAVFTIPMIVLGLAGVVHAQGFTIKMNGDVMIPADTVHEGVAMTMNGRIQVDGTLRGDAITMNGDISVSGTVTGSVRTFNGNVTMLPTARVEGDVTAVNGRVDQQPGSVVTGQVSQGSILSTPPQPQQPQLSPQPQPPPPPSRPRWWERREEWRWERRWPDSWIRAFFGWATIGFIALTALIALLFPSHLQRIANGLSSTPGQAFLAGIAVWVALPILAVALAISIIGIPALVLLPLAVGVLAIFGFAATSLLLGDRLGDAIRRETNPVVDTIIGAVILGVLGLVPGIGWLALFLAVTWGIGGFILLLVQRFRRTPPPAPAT